MFNPEQGQSFSEFMMKAVEARIEATTRVRAAVAERKIREQIESELDEGRKRILRIAEHLVKVEKEPNPMSHAVKYSVIMSHHMLIGNLQDRQYLLEQTVRSIMHKFENLVVFVHDQVPPRKG